MLKAGLNLNLADFVLQFYLLVIYESKFYNTIPPCLIFLDTFLEGIGVVLSLVYLTRTSGVCLSAHPYGNELF